MFEATLQLTLFLQMDVAGSIAGLAANAGNVSMLDGRVEKGLVQHCLGVFQASKLALTPHDGFSIRQSKESILRHEWVLGAIGTLVVHRTLPIIALPVS